MGLVAQVFDESKLRALVGDAAIGHTRYSTTGSATWQNSQPIVRHRPGRTVALGHNGNLTNTSELRDELLERGVQLDSTSDTEVICALIAAASGQRCARPRSRRCRASAARSRPCCSHRGRDRLPRPGRHPPARARRPRRRTRCSHRRRPRSTSSARRPCASSKPGELAILRRRWRARRAGRAAPSRRRGALRLRAHLLRPARRADGRRVAARGARAHGRAARGRERRSTPTS